MPRIRWMSDRVYSGSMSYVVMGDCDARTPEDVAEAARAYHASRRLGPPERVGVLTYHNRRADFEAVYGPQSPWISFADYTAPKAKPKCNGECEVLVHAGKVWSAP